MEWDEPFLIDSSATSEAGLWSNQISVHTDTLGPALSTITVPPHLNKVDLAGKLEAPHGTGYVPIGVGLATDATLTISSDGFVVGVGNPSHVHAPPTSRDTLASMVSGLVPALVCTVRGDTFVFHNLGAPALWLRRPMLPDVVTVGELLGLATQYTEIPALGTVTRTSAIPTFKRSVPRGTYDAATLGVAVTSAANPGRFLEPCSVAFETSVGTYATLEIPAGRYVDHADFLRAIALAMSEVETMAYVATAAGIETATASTASFSLVFAQGNAPVLQYELGLGIHEFRVGSVLQGNGKQLLPLTPRQGRRPSTLGSNGHTAEIAPPAAFSRTSTGTYGARVAHPERRYQWVQYNPALAPVTDTADGNLRFVDAPATVEYLLENGVTMGTLSGPSLLVQSFGRRKRSQPMNRTSVAMTTPISAHAGDVVLVGNGSNVRVTVVQAHVKSTAPVASGNEDMPSSRELLPGVATVTTDGTITGVGTLFKDLPPTSTQIVVYIEDVGVFPISTISSNTQMATPTTGREGSNRVYLVHSEYLPPVADVFDGSTIALFHTGGLSPNAVETFRYLDLYPWRTAVADRTLQRRLGLTNDTASGFNATWLSPGAFDLAPPSYLLATLRIPAKTAPLNYATNEEDGRLERNEEILAKIHVHGPQTLVRPYDAIPVHAWDMQEATIALRDPNLNIVELDHSITLSITYR